MGLQDFNYTEVPQVTADRILSRNWILLGGGGGGAGGVPASQGPTQEHSRGTGATVWFLGKDS